MKQSRTNPILVGIIDTFVGAELIRQSQIPHRNRLAVILIDSAFETACRAYLQHVCQITLSDAHKHRDTLIKTVKSRLKSIDEQVWKDIHYYYTEIRCDFYHQSAGKTITDVAFLDYRDTVEFVVNEAFGVKIADLVSEEFSKLTAAPIATVKEPTHTTLPVSLLSNKTDKVLLAVARLSPQSADEVNEFFKQEGETLRLKKDDFVDVVGRHSGSKKFFYFDKSSKRWKLSGLGQFKLSQLLKGTPNGN